MTDMKKTTKTKAGAKVNKLRLNKETIKDLSPRGSVKGGANANSDPCTQCGTYNTGNDSGGGS